MNYWNFLCGVYEICFRTPAKLNAAETPNAKSESPKFYDYSERPIVESFIGASTINVYTASNIDKTSFDQTKVPQFYKPDWDITPKSCAGDWLLRYSQNETNFNPWKFNTKFSPFELVPWRQQNKRIDLENAIGWERFELTTANQQQLRTLQKFETARTKRLQKQHIKTQKDRFRRQIKIRFILSLEVHQKKMKLFRSPRSNGSVATQQQSQYQQNQQQQRQLVLQRNRQLFVFNENAYDLAEHWGYFSQRYKGVEEMLVRNASELELSNVQKSIIYRPSSASSNQSRNYSPSNHYSCQQIKEPSATNNNILCENCRNRCVFNLISHILFCFWGVIVKNKN